MATNRYTYEFVAEHNNWRHVDIRVLRDGVEIGVRRLFMDGQDEAVEPDVLEHATQAIRSARRRFLDGEVTAGAAQTWFESQELFR